MMREIEDGDAMQATLNYVDAELSESLTDQCVVYFRLTHNYIELE